jgi:nicotinamidase-related amidase
MQIPLRSIFAGYLHRWVTDKGGSMKRFFILLFLVLSAQTSLAEESRSQHLKIEQIRPALLVIDVQNEYLPFMSEENKPLSFRMINGCIWLFRQKGLPIIRVYNTHPQWGPEIDSEAFAFPSAITVTENDPKIVKNFPNAFRKTDLDSLLKEKGCNTLFLCGLSATGCVLATYHGAAERDYDVFMVKDAVMSPNRTDTKVIEDISNSVNIQTLIFMLDHILKPMEKKSS